MLFSVKVLKTRAAIVLAMSAMLDVTGCGSSSSVSAEAVIKGEHSAAQIRDLAKYTTPVTLSIGRMNDTSLKFLSGQSWDNNDIYQAYNKELGIQIKNAWVVSPDQYNTKINLSITSGDIPDLLEVPNREMLKQLVDEGLVQDMTPYFKNDLSQTAQKYFTIRNQMASATFNGKLMAIPFTDSPYNSMNFVWLRKDWLDKLHLSPPKTMSDVFNIAQSFAKDHPGSEQASYGLAATKDLNNPALGLQGFFNGFGAYPNIWVQKNGKLEYGSVQPQMKSALAALQKMYKAGEIDPGFAVKGTDEEAQLISNNEVGMGFGVNWLASYPLIQSIRQGNKITQQWAVYGIPGKSQVDTGVDGYYVISKKYTHPGAVFEMLNKWVKVGQESPDSADYQLFEDGNSSDQRDNYWKLNPVILYPPTLNLGVGKLVPEAIDQHNPSLLTDENQKNYYKQCEEYAKGDTNLWNSWAKAGPDGSYYQMYEAWKSNQYVMNAFYGPPTKTMTQRWSTLQDTFDQGFLQIIMGQKPMTYFDTLVQQWKQLGGADITSEVNTWYKTAKKENVVSF